MEVPKKIKFDIPYYPTIPLLSVYIPTMKKWKTVYFNEMYAIHVYSSIIHNCWVMKAYMFMYTHTHIYIYIQSHIYPHSLASKNTNVYIILHIN